MWLHLLIFTVILGTDSHPELLYARPGDILPLTAAESNTTLEASFGPGAAVPVTTLKAPENGLHLLALFARDSLGNVSVPKWYLVHVDDISPEVTLTFSQTPVEGAQGKLWVGPNTRVQIDAKDLHSGVETVWLDLNGSVEKEPQTSLSVLLEKQGAYQIKGSAQDKVGNQAQTLEKTISVDLTPPQGKLTLSGIQKQLGDRLILGPNATIEATIQDKDSGLASWTPLLNGNKVTKEQWSGPWKKGRYELSTTAVDHVGNSAKVGHSKFEIDTEPPKANWEINSEIFTNNKGVKFYRLPIEINLKAQDDIFGPCDVEYFQPEIGWRPLKGPMTINETQLTIRSKDAVGNELNQTLTWPQDHIGPRIALKNQAGEALKPDVLSHIKLGDELFPVIHDEESGISRTYFHFNHEAHKPLPDRFRFRKTEEMTITIYAEDYLGNISRLQYPILVTRQGKRSNP